MQPLDGSVSISAVTHSSGRMSLQLPEQPE